MKVLPLFFCIVLVSCSTAKNEQLKIDEKVAQQTTVSDGKTLGKSVQDLIGTSKTLDEKQKADLEKLFVKTRDLNKGLLEKSFKLRAVLVKELLAGEENSKQIKLLKKEIKKTESLRLKSTFSAMAEISRIVRKDVDAGLYAEHMMYMDHIR